MKRLAILVFALCCVGGSLTLAGQSVPSSTQGRVLNHSTPSVALTEMEYWFDNDFGQRFTLPATATFNQSLNVNHLPFGRHSLHYRLVDAKGNFGSTHSHTFHYLPRHVDQQVLRYWFDNDSNHVYQSALASDQTLYLDVKTLPEGRHTLHYVVDHPAVGTSSPAEHSFFYHKEAPLYVRYWLSDGEPQTATLEQICEKGFRFADPPRLGRHVLNYCLVKEGVQRTPLHQVNVLRLPRTFEGSLRPTEVQYVVDNQFDKVQTLDISAVPFNNGHLEFLLPIETTAGKHSVILSVVDAYGSSSAWNVHGEAEFANAAGRWAVVFDKPAHGRIVVSQAGGSTVVSGMQLPDGTQLTLETLPDAGYECVGLQVNGSPYEGRTLTLHQRTTLSAEFQLIQGIGQVEHPDFGFALQEDGQRLAVQLPPTLQSKPINIYGIDGRQLLTQPAQGAWTFLNVSQLPAGVYVLRVGECSAKWMKR